MTHGGILPGIFLTFPWQDCLTKRAALLQSLKTSACAKNISSNVPWSLNRGLFLHSNAHFNFLSTVSNQPIGLSFHKPWRNGPTKSRHTRTPLRIAHIRHNLNLKLTLLLPLDEPPTTMDGICSCFPGAGSSRCTLMSCKMFLRPYDFCGIYYLANDAEYLSCTAC